MSSSFSLCILVLLWRRTGGAGDQENRGREGYGRREERGRKEGFPKWREPGEKEKKIAILRNILQ